MHPGWTLNRRFTAQPVRGDCGRWVLESTDDAVHGSHLQLLLHGIEPATIRSPIDIREIRVAAGDAPRCGFMIHGPHGVPVLRAQTVHVHELAGPRYRALPPPQHIPVTRRWLWKLLLLSLRVPGAFALLSWLRR